MTAPLAPDPGPPPNEVPAGGLGVTQGAALTLGAVLGTGVISLPALATRAAGPASLVAWLALVLLSIPLATTFAALGARYPDGGGVSTYARRAFGARAATVVGWCFYFAIPMGAPAAAGFAGAYVADSLGGGRETQLLTTAALIVVVGTMNWYGIRVSGRVQLAIAATLAALLLVATVVSLPHARLDNLTPFAPHGWAAVGTAAALLIWAFAGWEVVTSLSGEYRNPGRDIARATWIALAVMGVLYLGIAFATVAVLGEGTSKAPLSDLLVLGFGEPARAVTTVVAVLLSLGAMNAFFAGGARLGAALGRDASLPVWFARGSTAGEIPHRSLAVTTGGALATLLVVAVTGIPVERTMLLVTGAFTLVYVVGTAAAIRLLPRRTWVRREEVIAFASTLVLLVLTGRYLLPQLVLAVGAIAWTMRPAARGVTPVAPGSDLSERRDHYVGPVPTRWFVPLALATLVAVVSTGLLVVAVGAGWLGPDVGRGDNFCEAARDSWVKQPANSFSNLGFVVAGLMVAWRAGRPDLLGDVLPRHAGLATAYACVVVLLGPASAAMHATQSEAGGRLDLLSMYLVASFAAAYALMRWLRRDRLFFAQLFALFVAFCELVGLYDGRVAVVEQPGNVAFAALLLTAVVLEIRLWRRGGTRTDLRWGAGALGAILLAFAIWNVTKSLWCDPHSLVQGHAMWHLLDAVSAYLLFRLWASERTVQ